MKRTIKACLKYGIFLFGILFLLPQCQKDDVAIDTEIAQEKMIQRISLENLTSKIGNTTSYRDLSAIFDVNKKNGVASQKELSTTSEVWLNTDEIVMIQNNDIAYYTFVLETNTAVNQLYNLVAAVNNQGTIEGMQILEYTPSSSWLTDTSEPFTGSMKLIQNTFFTTADIANLLQAESTGGCVIGLDYQWECDAGNEHAPNTCLAGGSNFIIFPVYGDCPESLDPGGSNGGGDNSYPINPNSGGGNNGSSEADALLNDDRIATTPIVVAFDVISNCMNGDSFNPRLSQEAQIWLKNNRDSSTAISNYLMNVGCNEYAQDFIEEAIEVMMANEDVSFEEYIEQQVEDILEANPFALLEIDCNQIGHWQTLAQHTAPQLVKDKIEGLHANHEAILGDWQIQSLEEAGGKVLNLDYFAVKVTTLPNNPLTGTQFNPQDFLVYFRKNINNFTNGSTFEPYCEISSICEQETNLWNTTNILGAIVKLDIPAYNGIGGDTFGNDGVVVCSEFTNNYWNFMTMEAPYDYSHPVSGTRQFGYETNLDGSYNFYVRGVDRFNSRTQEIVAGVIFGDDIFSKADDLWETFQEKLSIFVNANGGSSTIVTPVTNRADWEKVKDVLQGKRPTSDLGCN